MDPSTNPVPDPQRNETLPKASDQSLLDQFREGEKEAAARLHQRYASRLRRLVSNQISPDLSRRLETEDVVQSVFRTFFRRVGEGQYEVPDGEDLWKLFLVIALNKVRAQGNYHRAARRNVGAEVRGEKAAHLLERVRASDDGAQAHLEVVISDLLDQLPPTHRRIVELRMAGFGVGEIAEQIQRSRRTTERVLQQIRNRLAEYFNQEISRDEPT